MTLPRIRSGLLRHTLDNQVLIYDSRDDRVHLLDPTTACVLELLEEGGWTSEGITAELAVRLGVAENEAFLLWHSKSCATPTCWSQPRLRRRQLQ